MSQGVDVEGLSSFLEVDMELLLCLDVEKKVKEPVYNKMNDNFDETSMTAPLLL